MRYNCKGFRGCDSCCDIEVQRRSNGKYVFVATEVPDNPGTSVTNFAEQLATAMRRQHGLKPEDVIWIEHYPEAKGRRKESFDLVRFGVEGDSFRTPVWNRVTEQAVDDLIAGTRNIEDLIPRRIKEALAREKGLGAKQLWKPKHSSPAATSTPPRSFCHFKLPVSGAYPPRWLIGWLPVSCHASRTRDRYDRALGVRQSPSPHG
jgi:hypothetical protein